MAEDSDLQRMEACGNEQVPQGQGSPCVEMHIPVGLFPVSLFVVSPVVHREQEQKRSSRFQDSSQLREGFVGRRDVLKRVARDGQREISVNELGEVGCDLKAEGTCVDLGCGIDLDSDLSLALEGVEQIPAPAPELDDRITGLDVWSPDKGVTEGGFLAHRFGDSEVLPSTLTLV